MRTKLQALFVVVTPVMVAAAACSAPPEHRGKGDRATVSSDAITGEWTPPNVATHGSYTGGGPWNGGKSCAGGHTTYAQALSQEISSRFGAKVQGYACRQNTANASELSVHGTGRALDIFATGSEGTKIADWLVQNSQSLGIQFVIWSRTKWNRTKGAAPYTGPNPHTDHIHAEIGVEVANRSSVDLGAGGATDPTSPPQPGMPNEGDDWQNDSDAGADPWGNDDGWGHDDGWGDQGGGNAGGGDPYGDDGWGESDGDECW